MPERERDVCRICHDPRMDEIEAALTEEGLSMRATADRYGLSRDTVMRHKHRHMATDRTRPRLVVIRKSPEYPPPSLPLSDPEPQPGDPDSPPPPPEPEVPKTEAERKAMFLDVFGETGSQIKSRRAAGVALSELRGWHEHDEQFGFLFNIAAEQAKDALIDVARERAIHGTKQVLQIYRRQLLIEERIEYKPPDAALLALLKAMKPELFGDKLAVTQTTVVKTLDAAAWEAL